MGFADAQIATGLTSPATLTALPDGRVLVVQQNGVIRLVANDVMLPASFWEVPNVDSEGERGCLGITPDPDFLNNHYVYVYCTILSQTSNNHVIRVTEANGTVVDGSATLILALPDVTSIWHMGGALRFGPDGMLYVAVGNHEDDPQSADRANSQNLSNPFGKILRILPDGSVPADNPFVGRMGAYEAILSYGFRNPFAFDIQPGTGRIFIGDVGQTLWEEINDNKPGANYGWPIAEGPSTDPRFAAPFYAYDHNQGRCSITGGAFYNPTTPQFPAAYVGKFLFQEFCAGTIQALDPETAEVTPFVTDAGFPTNLVVTPDGSVYYLSRNQDTMTNEPGVGSVNKLTYTGTGAPRISRSPVSQTVVLGDPVTFEVVAAGADAIAWLRDDVVIAGATESKYTLAATTQEDNGAVFTARATNELGVTDSAKATLTITTNRPPVAAIAEPTGPLEYSPGQSLTFGGSATDETDGELPASAFTWLVDFQHDIHTHPLVAAKSGESSVTFMVPDFEADQANTWLRVYLTAKDSGDGTHTVLRDVFPGTQLSGQQPVGTPANGSGPYEVDQSNGGAEAGDGVPLVIAGTPYLKGLGVSAPSELRFSLDGRCSGRFIADVGVDDEVGDKGSVVFQAFLDDKSIYESKPLRGADGRENIAVSVAGGKTLRLVVTDGGDGNSDDHADWGGARVTGCTPDAAANGGAGGAGSEAGSGGSPAAGSGGTGGEADSGGTGGEAEAGSGGAEAEAPPDNAEDEASSTASADAEAGTGGRAGRSPGNGAGGSAGEASVTGEDDAANAKPKPAAAGDADDGGCAITRPTGTSDTRSALWMLTLLAVCVIRPSPLRRRR